MGRSSLAVDNLRASTVETVISWATLIQAARFEWKNSLSIFALGGGL